MKIRSRKLLTTSALSTAVALSLSLSSWTALATCVSVNQDYPQCDYTECCIGGVCSFALGSASNPPSYGICLGSSGTEVSGYSPNYTTWMPNCISEIAVDAGPQGAICVGGDTNDSCNDDSWCASGICDRTSCTPPVSPFDCGECRAAGYNHTCTVGYSGGTRGNPTSVYANAGCASNNCVLNSDSSGVCGLPYKDAGTTGTPCTDSSWCWAPGGFTCDLSTQTCIPACQGVGTQCDINGLGDCCGTNVCVGNTCQACVSQGHACNAPPAANPCCEIGYGPHNIIPDNEIANCSSVTNICGINGPNSTCNFNTDCQDPNWLCQAHKCTQLGPSQGGCLHPEDCGAGELCQSGTCCLPSSSAIPNQQLQTWCCSGQSGPDKNNVFHCK